MDEGPAGPQEAAFLAVDLATNAFGGGPVPGPEFGRTKESALMDGIERSGWQEVEGARDSQVDPMMLERLAGKVSDVEPDRVRPELQEQPTHPRLELRGRSARDG